MPQRGALSAELTEAYAVERLAWEKVSGRLPGSPQHDPEAWQRWLAAVRIANALSEQVGRLSPIQPKPEGD